MKRTRERITELLNAITFAEAGDHETARAFAECSRPSQEASQAGSASGMEALRSHTRKALDGLGKSMAAAVFAEAGEFRYALEILPSQRKDKTVLLAVDGESPDPDALRYAAGLCKRMEAELHVLQVISRSNDEDGESLNRRIKAGSENVLALHRELNEENIPVRIDARAGDVSRDVFRYTKRHGDVAVVVFDSPRARDTAGRRKGLERILRELSRKLSVPLITAVGKTPLGASPL